MSERKDIDQPPCPTGDDLRHQVSRDVEVPTGPLPGQGPLADDDPPDGGLQAWLNVLGCHIVILNTWGIVNSFGVFQPYYADMLSRPPSDISWIGSFQVFLLYFIGTFTGRLTDGGHFRIVFGIGYVLFILGMFLASLCSTYWQFFLAQGVCMGIGNGFLFCPSMAVIATYFRRHRALAMGITASGSSIGGIIYPLMVRQLLPSIGFGWTIRAVAFVQMATLAVSGILLKSRLPPRKSGPLVEWAAFAETEYSLYVAGCFSCYFGVYFAFYYVAAFSRDNLGFSFEDSLNLIMILNGISAIGRILPNHFADGYGPITLYIPLALFTGAIMYCWIAVQSSLGMYIWTSIYGIWTGGVQSMFPAGVSSLTTDPTTQGTRLGMAFTIISFATLAGQPVAGAIVKAQGGKYSGAQAFAGTCMVLGAVFFTSARFVRARKLQQGWAAKV